MAYRIEQNDKERVLVLDGLENGIAISPHAGIASIKNADIVGVPGQASVGLKPTALTTPPTVSAVAFTSDITTDRITVASTSGYYNGMAIEFNSIATTTGISTGRVYWIGDLSGNTFKVYKSPARGAGAVADLATGNGSGTLSSYTLGRPIDQATGQSSNLNYPHTFILDKNGRAWWRDNLGGTPTTNLVYMGNDTLTGGNGRAIATWQNHLIIFRESAVDGIGLPRTESSTADFDAAYSSAISGGWIYGWESIGALDSSDYSRSALAGQDNILYFDNGGSRIGSLSAVGTVDLDDGATFTKNTAALDVPEDEDGALLQLAELGKNLLIAGKQGKIYPWDRTSSSFDLPIKVPDKIIYRMKSSGQNAYIMAGKRGRIYKTNGTSIDEWKKIPDHLSQVPRPQYTPRAIEIDQNELYFSFSTTENDGSTAVGGLDGVWAINLSTEVLRMIQASSHGTNGTVYTIMNNPLSDSNKGSGLIVGWESSTATYGVDIGSTGPYVSGETAIEWDAVPLSDTKFPITPTKVEFKLSRALVAGESIQLLQRSVISGSYVSVGTFSTAGKFSGEISVNFQDCEWLQVQALLTSTASTPSFVPLREIRIALPA